MATLAPHPGAAPAHLLTLASGLSRLADTARPTRLPRLHLLAGASVEALRLQLRDLRFDSARSVPPVAADFIGLPCRLAILADDAADLAAKAALADEKLARPGTRRLQLKSAVFLETEPAPAGRTIFLFPGQGSQHPGMLDELCAVFPRVRRAFEAAERHVADLPIPALGSLAYPPAGLDAEDRAYLERELYGLRGGAQLSLVANVALHDLLVELGVRCDLMLGHSNGEHAALFASRTFRSGWPGLLGAMRAMIERAVADPPPSPPESVISVSLRDRAVLDGVLEAENGLHVAMLNGPTQIVLAGPAAVVERAAGRITALGGIVVRVPLDRAYHTPHFAGWAAWLRGLYDRGDIGPGEVPLYSCMTAAPYPAEPDAIRDLVARQWAATVDFERTVRQLHADGVRVFLEVGPGNTLTGLVGDILRGQEHVALSSSLPRQPSIVQLLRLIARLFVHGLPFDLRSPAGVWLWQGDTAEEVPEDPPHPPATAAGTSPAASDGDPRQQVVAAHFDLMREFLASQERILGLVALADPGGALPATAPDASAPPTIGSLVGDATRREPGKLTALRRFDLARDPLLLDHALGGGGGAGALAVLPFTFSLAVAAEAALCLAGEGVVAGMRNVRGYRWLALDRGTLDVAIRAEARADAPGWILVRLFQSESGREHLAFEAEVEVAAQWPAPPAPTVAAAGAGSPPSWTPATFYRDYAFHGPAFHGLRAVSRIAGPTLEATLAALPRPAGAGEASPPAFVLDPAVLDCAGQMVGFWLLEAGHRDFGIFPYQLRELRVYGPEPAPGAPLAARAEVRWPGSGATSADIEIADARGVLYALRGFDQRFLALPPTFTHAVMGKSPERRFLSGPLAAAHGIAGREIAGVPLAFLEESWGVWGRALAHAHLGAAELDAWYGEHGRSTAWLLGRVAAKELVGALAAAQGLDLPSAAVTVAGPAAGRVEASWRQPLRWDGGAPAVTKAPIELHVQGEVVRAVAAPP